MNAGQTIQIERPRRIGLAGHLIGRSTATAALVFAVNASAQTNPIPLFQYAIFYNSLCEFTWCAPMTINGRVHINGNLYTGTAWPLIFNSLVDVTGTISSPAWDGHYISDYSVPAKYNNPGAPYITNSPSVALTSGLADPRFSQTALREIINQPPPGGDSDPSLAALRYYNKAGVVLLVSNATITAIYRSFPGDSSPVMVQANYYPTNNAASNFVSIATNFPFLSVTNYWPTNPMPVFDQRENATLLLTDFDISVLRRWLFTNPILNAKFPNVAGAYSSSSNAPNILYVADNRTCIAGQLAAVRLRNSQIIPTNLFVFGGSNVPSGFTVATPNPLYIHGNYNCPNSAGLNSTNTALAGAYPASLVCDALTILSPNWQDSQSSLSLTSGSKSKAVSTTINAAIIAGSVYTTGSGSTTYSGGVHNLPRLLEDWGSGSSVTLTLNTSLANLYASARATNQFINPGTYYLAPTRQYNFDPNFLSFWKLPPGTPSVQIGGPIIVSSPQNQKAPLGKSATFSVAATGIETLRYQWRYLGPASPHTIGGATNSSFTLSNIVLTNAGTYAVTVTNLFGVVLSQGATLAIGYPPVITGQPLSRSVTPGTGLSFTVNATGTNLAYTWLFNGSALASGSVSTVPVTAATNTAGSYQVIVSNPDGAVTSSIAQLYLTTPNDFAWARTASVADGNSWSRVDGVAADTYGRCVAGRFAGTTLDLGGIILTNNNWSAGNSANFICRYAGNAVWARIIGTNSGPGCPLRIARGSVDGFMLVAGRFSGSADFDTIHVSSVTAADQFVLRFGSETPSIAWVKTFPTGLASGFTNAFGLAYSVPQSEWFISGEAGGTIDFGNGVILTNCSAYVAKIDSHNQVAWAREASAAEALALGATGDVFVAASAGLLTHYDAQGNILWSRPFPSARAIITDSRQNVYATGSGAGTFDGFALTNSGGNSDFFIAKCDSSGQIQWMRQLGSVNQQSGNSIALDHFNNIYVASGSASGLAEPLLNIGPSTLSNCFTFTASYDPAGNPLWARAITSPNVSVITSLDVYDSNAVGSFYSFYNTLGGYFTGTAYLGALPFTNTNACSISCPEQMFMSAFFNAQSQSPINISAQPTNSAVVLGADATFSVTASSSYPLGYQWFYNQTNLLVDATNSQLVVSNVQASDLGNYSVVLSNVYETASSAAASLTSAIPPTIDVSLQNITAIAGQNIAFNASASGIPAPSYVWQFNGSTLPDATGASLSLTNVSADLSGQYTLIATNLAGTATNSALLSVYPTAAATLTALPSFSGDRFQFSVSGVPGFSYVIETSTNFIDWEPLITNTSPFTLTDDQVTNYPSRFYRSVYVP